MSGQRARRQRSQRELFAAGAAERAPTGRQSRDLMIDEQILTLVQVSARAAAERDAVQIIAQVVYAAGGTVTVPRRLALEDYDLLVSGDDLDAITYRAALKRP